jgi:hypothetical protein
MNDLEHAAEFCAFVQACSNFLGQSRAIAGIHEREEVVVLAGESTRSRPKSAYIWVSHRMISSRTFQSYVPIPAHFRAKTNSSLESMLLILVEPRNAPSSIYSFCVFEGD